jgi:WD40 repeat protein
MLFKHYFLILCIGLTYSLHPAEVALTEQQSRSIVLAPVPNQEKRLAEQMAEFVVRIDGKTPGTGFIINKKGFTYTVLTNAHVVRESIEQSLTTSSGRKYSFTSKNVKVLPGVDLAEVTFSSTIDYNIAKLSKNAEIKLGEQVYTYGWNDISETYPVRRGRFSPGIVTTILPTDINHNGFTIGFDIPARPGFSGSPVCKENGEVIGVYGLGERYLEEKYVPRSSLGIPISTYQKYANIDRGTITTNAIKIQNPITNNQQRRKRVEPAKSVDINFSVAYSFNGIDLLPVSQDSQTFDTFYKNSSENESRLRGASASVTISPNGQTVVTGDSDGNLTVWRLQNGQLSKILSKNQERSIKSLAISSDEQTLIRGDGSDIAVTRLSDGKTLHYLYNHRGRVNALAVSPDGQTFVSGSMDKTIKIWRLQDGQLIRTLNGHQSFVNSVAISPDGQKIVSGSSDNTIKIWRLSDGQLLNNLILDTQKSLLNRNRVNSVAISPDGQKIVSGGDDVKVWKLQDGKLLYDLGEKNVNSVAISPDGQTFVTGDLDNNIRVWRLQDGKLLSTFSGHQSSVNSVAISPDGHTLISGSRDRNIKVWRASPKL